MKAAIRLIILLLFFCSRAHAQNTIGFPEIWNHSKQEYLGGTQNWDICQDKNGVIYFANNEGLLSYDGTYWDIYPLPNKTIVRSVAIHRDQKIFAGGQDEAGYFEPNGNGTLQYQSLKPLIPEKHRSFADVWDIICLDQRVFFRTNKQIMEWTGDQINVYPSNNWLFMGNLGNYLLAQDEEKGILKYDQNRWTTLFTREQLPNEMIITAVMAGANDTNWVATLKHGIFLYHNNKLLPFSNAALAPIASYYMYSAAAIDADHFAVGTSQQGCFIINNKGQIVQHFSRREGLQNNNILSVYTDRNKNLWLGLDHGIDFIAYSSAIKNITPDRDQDGSGYSSIIHNHHLYLSTTNGLYQAPVYGIPDLSFLKASFEPVPGTNGQAWNVSEVNGRLLLGHHEGFWEIRDGKAIPIDKSSGYWIFLPMSAVPPSPVMVAGTYNGLEFYDYKEERFVPGYPEARFESARYVTIHDNEIWVSHPYKGVFRVTINDGGKALVETFGPEQGLATTTNGNYVFKVKNRIVACTENGIYEYQSEAKKFEPSGYLNNIFGNTPIRYLKEDASGNIWFVFEKTLGVVDFSGPAPRTIHITELNRKIVSGFEHVNPVDAHNIFVGGEKGFFHINYQNYLQRKPAIEVLIRRIKAVNQTDSLIFGGYVPEDLQQVSLPYEWNSLRIHFSAPLYEQQNNIEYSCKLTGLTNTWSEWSNKTEKEYVHLPAGTYQFEVKARNNLGNESAPFTYSFVILPPWYQTWWAYSLYAALLLYAVYLLYLKQKQQLVKQKRRYEEEQKRLHNLHQLELEKNEKEIVKLKNEKLEAEIQHKNKEMASATMHLVKKGELITRLKDELQKLSKTANDEKTLEALKKMIKTLGEDDRMDEDWEHFTIHFDKAHNDFFVALKHTHPNLTPNELKLCAYLRMNLSTKEMSQLMNISVRGVEISRYRLRKKLQIPTETNLLSYLMQFNGNGSTVQLINWRHCNKPGEKNR